MHMLQIVHRDIKPANIMFSKSLNKCVFIDFGCSEVISESIGYRILTKLVGTTAFCTDELLGMLKELTKRVDLYYNDLHALKKSI
jgi:serine/threonine protein kinase